MDMYSFFYGALSVVCGIVSAYGVYGGVMVKRLKKSISDFQDHHYESDKSIRLLMREKIEETHEHIEQVDKGVRFDLTSNMDSRFDKVYERIKNLENRFRGTKANIE